MKLAVSALICLTVAACCFGQEDAARVLSFEIEHPDGRPGGWMGGPAGTLFADEKVVHSGRWSARLERTADSAEAFSVITRTMPMDFGGTRIEPRGWLKTEGVSGMAGLWLREDNESGPVAFDNMAGQQLKGTHDWAQYSVSIPVRAEAKLLFYGFLISGTGKAWADDLELLVDGKPAWEAQKAIQPKTPLDLDHEFDAGSGVSMTGLSKAQGGEPCSAREGVGVSEVSPSGAYQRQAALGLRLVQRDAGGTGCGRPGSLECSDAEVDRRVGRGSAVQPMRDAE